MRFREITAPFMKDLLGQVVVARDDFLAEHPDVAVAFARGLAKATLFGLTNPEAAVRIHWRGMTTPEPDWMTLLADLEAYVRDHRPHGPLIAHATEPRGMATVLWGWCSGVPSARDSHARPKLMEKTMKRFIPLVFVSLLSMADHSVAQPPVESKGITSKVRLEEVISGHLVELNGKFKLRVTEVTFAPDGGLGVHHHVGPGVRYVVSGKVTFVQGGTRTIYAAGDYFYESGSIAHTAYNHTKAPLRIVFFEILPAEWAGATVIPPKAY